ncbi:unnamed protein product [Vitrella brassicaformis CCMP3155]|uniref:Bet v I/Major latex protein domain-containing protein n=1 Tax=Vitrella brassicaformis (strain CCMP3155) TaxID=1169540 RepID=A0A0G4EMH5_VITBC|nr:unnamed protein product [Vitrella brassicaformis CCMP3155]|mmetsp:Transcript_29329/g.84878  ORF Transcript_29329/g.84878 Transcript_29329/m.84878 type:complete len:172 (-) Transcript_29329:524-1039(-)|eukprot:CEL98374.1 unnamed protein product [Vitrella brassicaformis CCMP3155]
MPMATLALGVPHTTRTDNSVTCEYAQQVACDASLLWEKLEEKTEAPEKTLPVSDVQVLSREGNTLVRSMRLGGGLPIKEKITIDEPNKIITFAMAEDSPDIKGQVTNAMTPAPSGKPTEWILTYKLEWTAKSDAGKKQIENYQPESLQMGVEKMKEICESWQAQAMQGMVG